jgi:hypothetical protein
MSILASVIVPSSSSRTGGRIDLDLDLDGSFLEIGSGFESPQAWTEGT